MSFDPISYAMGKADGGGGTDTSDATITGGEQLLEGVTAYGASGKITGAVPMMSATDVTVSDNVVTVPPGGYAEQVQKTVGTAIAAQTIAPTASDQTMPAGYYLAGAQTVEGVVCTNLTAANIKDGVVVKIGTATDDDSVTSVTGEYQGGGGSPTLVTSAAGFSSALGGFVSAETFASIPQAVFGTMSSGFVETTLPYRWFACLRYLNGSGHVYACTAQSSGAYGTSSNITAVELTNDGKLLIKVSFSSTWNDKWIYLTCLM